ncbi:MAG: hypothetical protein LBV40_05195 [Methanomicrobiales archaeon]|nr:hypothetical protein [Methanomicrobiales archaeon]
MKNTLQPNLMTLFSIGIGIILSLSLLFLPVSGAEEQFISTTIEDPIYWITEGVKAFSIGDFEASLLMFNTAIALNSQYAPGWHWRSKALTELGNREAAQESLNVAEALEPNIQDPYRMRVGTLADISMTPIPTLRPIETDEDEDGYVKSTINTEKLPDPEGSDIVLKALEASVDPKTNQLNLTTTYANTGLKATRFFYITYHISSSSRITGEDQSIGYYFVKNLFPGEEKTVNLYIPISRIPIGEWYIAGFADLVNNVMEQSEENNAIALRDKRLVVPASKTGSPGEGYIVGAGAETTISLPDLQVGALSGSDIMYIGKETEIETTIQNIGIGDAGPFTARLILSKDIRVGEDDIILSEGTISELKAGTAIDGIATPIVPDMAPGYYYYGLVLDSESSVEESEKNNNIAFSPLPIRVIKEVESISDVAIADLIVESLSVPKTAFIGGQIEVIAIIRNDGIVSSGPIGVALYVSKDTTITENDILISYGKTELPAGTTRSASSVPVIPVDISPGKWYFGIILDPDETVSEKNRQNNIAVASHETIIS